MSKRTQLQYFNSKILAELIIESDNVARLKKQARHYRSRIIQIEKQVHELKDSK